MSYDRHMIVLATPGHGVSGKPLFSLPISRHFELLYNTGIQLLHCSKPLPAFDCLIEAVKVYSSNSRLWLRLAECCVMANRKVNDPPNSIESYSFLLLPNDHIDNELFLGYLGCSITGLLNFCLLVLEQ